MPEVCVFLGFCPASCCYYKRFYGGVLTENKKSVRHKILPEEAHAFAQGSVFGTAQVGITLPEASGERAGNFDQVEIVEVGDFQFGHAALAHADEVAGTAQAQVLLGELKAVVGVLEDQQAFLGLHAGVGAEDIAVGLVLAAPDASAKLVEL